MNQNFFPYDSETWKRTMCSIETAHVGLLCASPVPGATTRRNNMSLEHYSSHPSCGD